MTTICGPPVGAAVPKSQQEGRDARYKDGAYLLRRAMHRAISAVARSLAGDQARCGAGGGDRSPPLLVDIGGRGRPYAEAMAKGLRGTDGDLRHIVIDLDPGADVIAEAERLPLASQSADVVLCTQVLEHVKDPDATLEEMARVLKPEGVCLLTTHGTWFYHPDPVDYWRWTSAGLSELFARSGFRRISVEPIGGTKLALAVLLLTAFERSLGSGPLGRLGRGLIVAPVNFVAGRYLLRRATGRRSLPGELAINYLVSARPASREDAA